MEMFKMNPYVRSNNSKDYAGNLPDGNVKLDCSLGVNSKILPDLLFTKLHEFNNGSGGPDNEGDIKHYPHDESLCQRLADYYKKKGVTWITKKHFILGAGSYDILCNINMMCLTGGKSVLGHAPQFTAYFDHVIFSGSKYEYYQMKQSENNYVFDVEKYIAAMKTSHSLFIVENPNNPTGQIIRIANIQNIAKKAKEMNTILVVDEAYGDYMELPDSAINLIPEYPNVIVTRTFSKGFGMAGVRIGYAITSNTDNSDTLTQLQKLERPFSCSGIARVLARAMLDSDADMIHAGQVITNKNRVMKAVSGCKRLKYAATAARTPIIAIYYTGAKEGMDLQKIFLDEAGLLTVNCSAYLGLNSKTVRIMLPETENISALTEMLIKADQYLTEKGY
jgi:histidinol-phosphate aminotransferase